MENYSSLDHSFFFIITKASFFVTYIHLFDTDILLMELINITVTALHGVTLFVHKGQHRDTFCIGLIISS